MIHVERVTFPGGRTLVSSALKCEECGALAPKAVAGAEEMLEADLDALAVRRALELGWVERRRRHATSRIPYLASLCPKCAGVPPRTKQLGLDLDGRAW